MPRAQRTRLTEFEPPKGSLFSNAVKVDGNEVFFTKPSDFAEFGITVRVTEEDKPPRMENFSFAERKYLKPVYNTQSRRVLLKCGRQVEKSTSLGNICLAYACILPGFNILFVSPSQDQTRTFSRDRLKDPMETSDILKVWTDQKLADSVMLKQFLNRSKITLRYAFHNADRTRGIPADMILLDEIQDIYLDHIPVILECASHSPYKLLRFSGTPKSLDNAIEYYWTNMSTQNEWVVPCERHAPWYWNVLGEKNIQKKGLSCAKCGELINPIHDKAQWASMAKPKISEPYEGFRIPQLMVPWVSWPEILDKYEHYPRPRFNNEVLGLSFDTGTRPLTRQNVIDCCDPRFRMSDPEVMKKLMTGLTNIPVYAGIDWGAGGEHSFTVLTLGAYIDSKFTVFFVHRFAGQDAEPDRQIAIIKKIVRAWGVRRIGVDFGGGWWPNDDLIRTFGMGRVFRYQYAAPKKKVMWDDGLRRWMVNKAEVMADIFSAIKRGTVFAFPCWEDFEEPFSRDLLNIFSEYNDRTNRNQFNKAPGTTDDTFHSIIYCILASMPEYPRPDIILPQQERQAT